jgi:hypothetical protein
MKADDLQASERLGSSRPSPGRGNSSSSSSSRSGRSWDRRSVFVVCLLPSTRPSPSLRSPHQPGSHRILLHIPNQSPKLLIRTDPMIVGLILPKRQAAATQNFIRHTGGPSLEPPHSRRVLAPEFPNHVDMVRHDHPSVQFVQFALAVSVQQSIRNHLRHATIRQPHRPIRPARQRSGQPPRHGQNCIIRNPVRQMSAIQEHLFAKRQTTENRWSVLRNVNDIVVPAANSL